jgi:hypothetical protein
MTRRHLIAFTAATFLFASKKLGSYKSSASFLNSLGDWILARKIFYSEVPAEYFKLVQTGEWIGVSPVKSDFLKSITEVHTFTCPYRMSYFEYIEYSKKWVNWTEVDKYTVDALLSGLILKIHFKFDGNQGVSKITYNSIEDYNNRKLFYPANNPLPYPGMTTVIASAAII